MHERTIEGDCITLMRLERDGSFDAIATSPCYGNRMADDHTPSPEDTSDRNTYRHALGRPLSYGTSANLQWGPKYRVFHEDAWSEAARVLRVGGRFVLNVKDHIRDGAVVPVAGWHATTLARLGLRLIEIHPVASKGNRQGANGNLRVEHEWVLVFLKDPPVVAEVTSATLKLTEVATDPMLDALRAEVRELCAHRDALEEDRAALGMLANELRAQVESGLAEIEKLRANQRPEVDKPGGFVGHTATSRKAFLDVYPKTGTQRRRVLDFVQGQGGYGATDEEIQAGLNMSPNTERPRRVELVEGGWLVDSKQNRLNSAGHECIVWRAGSKEGRA